MIVLYTIDSEEEGAALLRDLRRGDVGVVIGDVVMNRLARQAGFNSILVTSGIESVRRALGDAVKTYRQQRVLKERTLLYQGLLEQTVTAVLFGGDCSLVYASDNALPAALLDRLRDHIAEVA